MSSILDKIQHFTSYAGGPLTFSTPDQGEWVLAKDVRAAVADLLKQHAQDCTDLRERLSIATNRSLERGITIDDLQKRVAELEALVKQQEHSAYRLADEVATLRKQAASAVPEYSDADLTRIYKEANNETEGKARPISTASVFRAMRAMAAALLKVPSEVVMWRIKARLETEGHAIETNSGMRRFAELLLAEAQKGGSHD